MQFLSPIMDWLAKQRLSIVTALTISFAVLVIGGLVAVLALGGWGGPQLDTQSLVKRAQIEADLLAQRTLSFVRPLQDQLSFLESEFRSGRIDLDNTDAVASLIGATMGASPHTHVAGYVSFRGKSILVKRNSRGQLATQLEPGIFSADTWNLEANEDGIVLAQPLYDESTSISIIPFIRRLQIGENRRLHVIVAIEVSAFSNWLSAPANTLAPRSFALYGKDRVLAFHGQTTNPAADEGEIPEPLLHVSDTKDPVLLALWRDETTPAPLDVKAINDASSADHTYLFRVARTPSQSSIITIAELNGITDQPWLVGTSFGFDPGNSAAANAARATWTVGSVILVLVALVYLLAKYITRPVEGLAQTARQVSRLQLESMPDVPRSIFREFDDAAEAFKKMSVGLDWFQSYVPSSLVRKLLHQADGGDLVPETKELTIMFTDVVGFTRLSEQLEAQDIVEMLNEHFSLIGQCIDQEAGTIDKYIGDGLMAFWGAPDHQPDHATRAVDAAEAITLAMADTNEARRDLGVEPISLRIGIFTGRVSIGNIGAPGRINYTVIGDAVNAAQRLERLGVELKDESDETIVLISAETIKSIERNASQLNKPLSSERFEFVGDHTLDGRIEPTGVYRLN